MPMPTLANPAGLFGLPVGTNTGNNAVTCLPVFNNSGAHMTPGDLVSWDTSTALSTVSTTTTGAQQLAVTATSYAVASSASFGTSGLVVAVGVTTTLGGVPQNLVGIISAKADGTHVTIAFIRAGAAGSLPAGTTLFVPPSTANSNGQVALAGTTGPALQAVTYPAVANDPLLAGVVLGPQGDDSATVPGSTLIAPGGSMYIAVNGPARVYIGGSTTVAASGLMSSTATLNADDVGTAGNVVATALEANGQKDANNTIRCFVKTA